MPLFFQNRAKYDIMINKPLRGRLVPGNFKKKDLRIVKSHRALTAALPKLLRRRNFKQLTVNDLCNESQLSRTAFYTHFRDKYDLLKYFLNDLKNYLTNKSGGYDQMEKKINGYIDENKEVIKNILEDADGETMELVYDFIIGVTGFSAKSAEGKHGQKHVTTANFCAGGIIYCLLWQVKNNFPPESKMMNSDLYAIINTLLQKETFEEHGDIIKEE